MKKFKLFSFILVLSILGVLPAFGEDEVYKTAEFTSASFSKGVSAYTGTEFTSTTNGFVVTLTNCNNNNKGWDYVKIGGKNGAYTGTIVTNTAIDKAVTKVNLTINAITTNNVTSITLYSSSDNSSWTSEGTFTKSNGTKTVTITSPAANKYYKISAVCTKGSSNGLLTISKVEYYVEKTSGGGGETTTCSTPTFSPNGATFYGASQSVEIACSTTGATIHYTTDGSNPTATSATYSEALSLTATTTVKAIAVKEGANNSEIASATFTKGAAVTSYVIDFETNNLAAYVNWVFDKLATRTSTITAHGGTYYAINANSSSATSGTTTATITTADKIATPGTLTFYISKESTNTTASSWKAQVSEDGSAWTDVETFDAKSMTKGNWNECTADLSDYSNVYVRISYGSSGAIRAIDDITLEMASAVAKPTISGTDNFFTTSEISITCGTAGNTIYYTTDGTDPKTSSTKQTYSAPFTINATTTIKAIANVGDDWSSANEKTFTQIETWTVAEANAQLALSSPINNKYVRGIVSQIDAYGSNAITYWISDDGSTTSQLEVYKGKGLDGANFSAITDLAIGDIVIVYGNLKVYTPTSGPSVNEFDNGNYLVQKEDPAVAAPVFSPDGGGFMGETDVTITCATASSTIYYTTDGTTPSKSSTPYTTAIHINATTTIAAIAYVGEEHSVAITKNFTLTAPMTVAEALTALDSENPINNVAVIGVISTAPTSNPSSGKLTYYISDDGTATDQLEVFNGFGLNGASFSDKTDLQVGDEVTVFGNLTIFSNTTKEFAQGSRLISFNRPTTAVTDVTLPATATVKVGKTKTLTATVIPSNATNKTINWSIESGDAYVTLADGVITGVAEGTAVIRAASAEDANIYAECTVSVIEGVPFATGDWVLVTDAAELTAGSYVIIAAADYGKAMKAYKSGDNNCKSKDATKDGDLLAFDADFGIYEIKTGNVDNTIALCDADNETYLYAASSSSNNLKAEENLSNNSSWAVDVTSEGVALLIAQGTNTRNTLKYNASSGQLLFSCYSSSSTNMEDIALYKYYAPVPKVIYDKNTDDDVTDLPGPTRAELEGNVYKATISTTVPHRSGYKFTGWKNGETSYVAGEKYTIDADVTIYAQWSALSPHHITYNTSGSTGETPVDATDYYLGDEVTLASASGLSNAGYFFDGWRVTYVDGESAVQAITVEEGKFTMPNYDVTATATWAPKSDDKWLLVTGTNMLEQNGEYVIVCAEADNNKYYAMSKTQNTNNRGVAEVELNDDNLVGSSSMAIFTLKTGTESNSWAFYDPANTGYIYAASSSKNYLQTQDENDANGSWIIEFGEGSVASITAQGANTHNLLKYNSGSDIFSCYTTGQQAVKLYKKKAVVRVEDAETTKTSEIAAGADVIIEDGGTLTVDDAKSLNDLTVKEGGEVRLSNDLTVVGTFIIKSVMGSGASGQLVGATTSNFTASDDAYIDITLGANGTNQQWHAFTVPFPVDVTTGIYDLAGTQLKNEVNYAIMEYFGDIRAEGKYGWKKIRTTLVPGTFYIMATDGYRTTYRFKKNAGAAIVAANSKEIKQYAKSGAGTDTDAGWNGVGNPTLTYGKVAYEVQVLDPESYTFVKKDANSTNFVVGTPFFYQASADGSISMLTADAGANYAPARTSANEIEKIKVAFGNEEYTDYLDISASEDATNEYQIGKDLVKMTMTNTPKVAQIFGVAYNTKLCMVNAPLHNDQAKYSLNLYAPADGEYTITVPDCDNADIYLTYDGHIIWNIAAGPYTGDFKQGDNNGYGLVLRRKPQVTTGVENSGLLNDANGVQKIILNDHVYILRGEQLYDVTGKMVR